MLARNILAFAAAIHTELWMYYVYINIFFAGWRDTVWQNNCGLQFFAYVIHVLSVSGAQATARPFALFFASSCVWPCFSLSLESNNNNSHTYASCCIAENIVFRTTTSWMSLPLSPNDIETRTKIYQLFMQNNGLV